jgi:hypothetical protein
VVGVGARGVGRPRARAGHRHRQGDPDGGAARWAAAAGPGRRRCGPALRRHPRMSRPRLRERSPEQPPGTECCAYGVVSETAIAGSSGQRPPRWRLRRPSTGTAPPSPLTVVPTRGRAGASVGSWAAVRPRSLGTAIRPRSSRWTDRGDQRQSGHDLPFRVADGTAIEGTSPPHPAGDDVMADSAHGRRPQLQQGASAHGERRPVESAQAAVEDVRCEPGEEHVQR